MLQKSKRSALILSVLAVLCFALMTALMDIALPYWLTGDATAIVSDPNLLSQPNQLSGLVIFLIVMLALLTLVGWAWINKAFGEDYYGRKGAWHWAMYGGLLGLFIALPHLLLQDRLDFLQHMWRYASPFPAFFLARWISGVKRTKKS